MNVREIQLPFAIVCHTVICATVLFHHTLYSQFVAFEEGHIIFNSDEGCTGEIWVVADFQNKFSVNINFYNCIENFYSTEYEFFGNVEVNGHNYTDAYLFRGNRELYFSKDIGILRIDGYSGEILYSLLE